MQVALDMVVLVCRPSIQRVETCQSGAQGHPELQSNFETSLGDMRPCLSKSRKNEIVSSFYLELEKSAITQFNSY